VDGMAGEWHGGEFGVGDLDARSVGARVEFGPNLQARSGSGRPDELYLVADQRPAALRLTC